MKQDKTSKKIGTKALKTAAKTKLKAMKKSTASHPVREEGRIIKYGAIGFARNIWLSTAATAVMSITLIILFVTIAASIVLANTAESMREKIDITVYLHPGVSEKTLSDLSKIMSADPNVKSVETATSTQEFEKYVEEKTAENDEDILELIANPDMKEIIIAKMQATMKIKAHNVDDLSSIKSIVENNTEFQKNLDEDRAPTYDVNQVEIATITTWANIARTGGIVLGAVFLVISILIIFSTIRMAIFSRREEIYMMRLVGADKGFIRGPFLIEAEICGIIAALISATVCYVGFIFLSPELSNYGIDMAVVTNIMESNQLILVYAGFLVAGILIGRISARLAIKKYLKA